jgi:hypothetical protein
MQKNKQYNAKGVAEFLTDNGLPNTANWIKYAFNNKSSENRKMDVYDILNSLKTEINFIQGMDVGRDDFLILIKNMSYLFYQIAETNGLLKEVVDVANTLDGKLKFYQFCFAYLILWEGPYTNVETALAALKQLSKGKSSQEIDNNKQLNGKEKKIILQEILPNCLKNGNHNNIRNAVAHCHFKYIDSQNQIEFWDVGKDGKYTLPATRLDFNDFSRKILEVKIFCEVFAITFLTLVAIEDIYN